MFAWNDERLLGSTGDDAIRTNQRVQECKATTVKDLFIVYDSDKLGSTVIESTS